jgi:hypothetical protein
VGIFFFSFPLSIESFAGAYHNRPTFGIIFPESVHLPIAFDGSSCYGPLVERGMVPRTRKGTRDMQTKWAGHGTVIERALPDDFTAQYDKLSKRMKYLVDYGWKQSTADSFASAKNAAEFEGKLNARIDKILSGEMVIRDGVTRTTDPVEKEVNRILADRELAWHRQRKAEGKPKASPELIETWYNQQVEKHGDEDRAEAERRVEAANAMSVDLELPE